MLPLRRKRGPLGLATKRSWRLCRRSWGRRSERGRTATGGRWRTSCSRGTSVKSGKTLKPSQGRGNRTGNGGIRRGRTTQTYSSIGLTRAGASKGQTNTSRPGSLTASPTTVYEDSGLSSLFPLCTFPEFSLWLPSSIIILLTLNLLQTPLHGGAN